MHCLTAKMIAHLGSLPPYCRYPSERNNLKLHGFAWPQLPTQFATVPFSITYPLYTATCRVKKSVESQKISRKVVRQTESS